MTLLSFLFHFTCPSLSFPIQRVGGEGPVEASEWTDLLLEAAVSVGLMNSLVLGTFTWRKLCPYVLLEVLMTIKTLTWDIDTAVLMPILGHQSIPENKHTIFLPAARKLKFGAPLAKVTWLLISPFFVWCFFVVYRPKLSINIRVQSKSALGLFHI